MASHRRSLRQGALALVVAALGVLGGGCRASAERVDVPVSNWPGYEYFYLAEQLGLSRRHGLDLRSVQYADPQTIVHAYLRGDAPLAQLTTVEAVDLCSRVPDRCPVVVLVLNESLGGDQVAARAGIAAIEQLRGRRVGVTYSTLGPYVLSRALEQKGLSLKDVDLRNISLDAMPEALARGTVDAVAIFPPYSERAARQEGTTTLFDSRRIPGEIFDVLVVDPQWLQRNRALLPPLLRSWQAAHDERRAHPRRAVELMARREGLTPAEFESAERGLRYFSLRQQLQLLAPGGPLGVSIRGVRRVQEQLNLVKPGSPLPPVSREALSAALR